MTTGLHLTVLVGPKTWEALGDLIAFGWLARIDD